MKFTKEQIAKIAEMTGYTPAKAEKYLVNLYKDLEDDTVTFDDLVEVCRCEVKRKENGIKNVVTSVQSEDKKKKPRTVKISDEKAQFFGEIVQWLAESGKNYKIERENKLIIVQIDEKTFKLDLVEQRTPKK